MGGAATGHHHDLLLVTAAAHAQRAGEAEAKRRRAKTAIECVRGSKRTAAMLRPGRHGTIPWHASYNETRGMRRPPTSRACERGAREGGRGSGIGLRSAKDAEANAAEDEHHDGHDRARTDVRSGRTHGASRRSAGAAGAAERKGRAARCSTARTRCTAMLRRRVATQRSTQQHGRTDVASRLGALR